jgi:hypothetical protein
MYNNETLKRAVDKFVIVLVGQPRGINSLSWRKTFPEQLKRTLYDDLSPEFEDYRQYLKKREGDLRIMDIPWGHAPDYKPEVHVICSTWETDSSDRYLLGEDCSLAGLDNNPYIGENLNRPIWPEISQGNKGKDILQKQALKLDSYMVHTDWPVDGTGLGKRRGLMPIKKDKFEAYHRKAWDWCDSVRFSYLDPYDLCNSWQSLLKAQTGRNHVWNSPSWAGQIWHFIRAYRDHKDLFDSLTKNSVVLRIRYDISIGEKTTLWHFAKMILNCTHCDQSTRTRKQDVRNIKLKGDKSRPPHEVYTAHHKHNTGFDISPVVLCTDVVTVAGQISAGDYWHAFDGPGACLFCEKWEEWCYEDVQGIPGLAHVNYDSTKRPSKTNERIFPEERIMKFILAHDYTIYDANLNVLLPIQVHLQSFEIMMTDQWRYDWYEGWDPSILEEIRNWNGL